MIVLDIIMQKKKKKVSVCYFAGLSWAMIEMRCGVIFTSRRNCACYSPRDKTSGLSSKRDNTNLGVVSHGEGSSEDSYFG